VNLDYLLSLLEEIIPTPKRDEKADPMMFVARSFDVNKPGSDPQKLIGGILGGVLKEGKLSVGDAIEMKPGIMIKKGDWKPINTTIVGITTGGEKVTDVLPGGSFGILTSLDPSIVKSDQLVGSIVGKPGTLPEVHVNLYMDITLLDRVVGSKDKLVVDQIKPKEVFMLNVNSAATVGIVVEHNKKGTKMALKRPVCAAPGSRVTLSRRLGQRWRLIGYGIIKK
jgi:translation initiation factor 2 subunit 3